MISEYNDINEILSFKPWNRKRKTYELFKIDYNLYANTSIYLEENELDIIRDKSIAIKRAISEMDADIEKHFVFSLNEC